MRPLFLSIPLCTCLVMLSSSLSPVAAIQDSTGAQPETERPTPEGQKLKTNETKRPNKSRPSLRDRMLNNASNGLFGYQERRYEQMAGFKKWVQMLERENTPIEQQISHARTKTTFTGRNKIRIPRNFNQRQLSEKGKGLDCSRTSRVQCKREKWDKFIQEQKKRLVAGAPIKQVLDAVNLYMNNTPYIVDPSNWGVPDYWATTTEFFYKDGDCEDYAISKYVTLKRIGFDTKNMRLVIGQDNNSRVEHAILAVKLEAMEYILDNQVDNVLPHTKIRHFTPVYAINEHAWWRHSRKKNY